MMNGSEYSICGVMPPDFYFPVPLKEPGTLGSPLLEKREIPTRSSQPQFACAAVSIRNS